MFLDDNMYDFSDYFLSYTPISVITQSNDFQISNNDIQLPTFNDFQMQEPRYYNTQPEEVPFVVNNPQPTEPQNTPQQQPAQQSAQPAQQPVQQQAQGIPSSKVQELINEARKHLKKRYVSGTHGPNTFDCSGFLYYVFKQCGIKIPLNIFEMVKSGTEIKLKDVRPGDIIGTSGSGKSGWHVAMVTDVKGDKITVIEAAGKDIGVREGTFTKANKLRTVRRINLGTSAKSGGKLISKSKFSKFY